MPEQGPSIEDILPPEADSDLQFMLAYWDQKRGENPFPGRPDIDPLDFVPILPLVYIIQGGALEELEVRLAGTQYRELYGFEITGKRIVDLIPPSDTQDVYADYRACVEQRVPIYLKGQMTWRERDSQLSYQRLLLPLGTPDGQLTHILGTAALFSVDGEKLFSRSE